MTAAERIEALREHLRKEPGRLDVAQEFWQALADYDGCDTRSGADVLEAFRTPALSSFEGTIALARAFKLLFELSGEEPPRHLRDEQLTIAIKEALEAAEGEDLAVLTWLWDAIH